MSVVSFELEEALNTTYKLDLVVTSSDHEMDGGACVGRRATFTIIEEGSVPSLVDVMEPVIEPARLVHGVVTRWERRSSSRDETTYALRIEPRFALLAHVHDSGVFRNKTMSDLIRECIVDRKLFDPHDIEFHLEGVEEKFEQTVMYEETVKGFIDRHCRRAGIYYYFKQGDKAWRDIVVFGNNPRGYVRALELPLMPDAGLNANWHEAVLSIGTVRELAPAAIELWDRNYREPADSLKASTVVAHDDESLFGRVNRSDEHHRTSDVGEMLAHARREELVSRQQTLYGTSNAIGMMPGLVARLSNRKLAEAPYGFLITRLKTKGSRSMPVFNEFEATPAHLTWRPPYDPATHWRKVTGALTGVIKSGSNAPYASIDEHGRYDVEPLFSRRSGMRGTHLMSLRLLRPSASYQGGFHSPLLSETEVQLVATDGDVDSLFIAGALHDYAHPDVVHGLRSWYTRSMWRSPLRGAKVRLEDEKGQEGFKASTVYMQTSVSLGYLVDSNRQPRGEGFEIHTEGCGTVHAPKGLFFSADALSSKDAPQTEMTAARSELQSSLQRTSSLAEATQSAKAAPADKDTQASLTDALDELKAPTLLASAPAGIGLVTPKSIAHAAGKNLIVTAGRHADISVMGRFTVAAGKLISLCSHLLGLKLFAAKGKVEIQAQSDALDLFAEKQLHIASAGANVLVAGKEKVVLMSGGAAITIENGNVVIGCPGEFRIKAASFVFEGPENTGIPLPFLPKSDVKPGGHYPFTR
ncbi:type VI secretion system tip protein VgrG [Paraburkholderia sp. SARCC-3016]|uniref:type VI secretion system Vgr family protein n=1 Tax=Paraburkholderia sp. SARCC-3016 TaxID=3058611 RepID=UPI00280782A3|nr:type VI secretion system tip protein VgrG [Paraburkholderia sp. SARCC-3016]MDQ7978444.1 type VI secretion system tip protein VgrG [Paraburkholderia sp. SARCC-3016]